MLIWILIAPMIVGAVVAVADRPAVVVWLDEVGDWLARKRTDYAARSGRTSRYLAAPCLSLMCRVPQWTEHVSHKGLRSGIRVAGYLYVVAGLALFAGALVYVAFVVVVAILFIWGFLWLLGQMLSGGEANRTTKGIRLPREEGNLEAAYPFGTTQQEKFAQLFRERELEIADDGTISRPPEGLTLREKVGFVDARDGVWDTRGFANRTRIGRIDEDGNVHE